MERPSPNSRACSFSWPRWPTELEAARLLVYNTARLKDSGQPFLREAAMAKLFSSAGGGPNHVSVPGAVRRIRLFQEYPAEKFYRDAKIGHDLRRDQQHAAADHRQTDFEAIAGRVRMTAERR